MKPHHDTVMIIYCNRKKNQIALSMEFFWGGKCHYFHDN